MIEWDDTEARRIFAEYRIKNGRDPPAVFMHPFMHKAYMNFLTEYKLWWSSESGAYLYGVPIRLWEKDELKCMEILPISVDWQS